MDTKSRVIQVAIVDDHQPIIDGYLYRLGNAPDIRVVATAMYGEELEPILAQHAVDVLLLDVQVPTSPNNPNNYPILHLTPLLLERYPDLNILVISMHTQNTLIRSLMGVGISGYILKDDVTAIRDLPAVVRSVASGGIYMSKAANDLLRKRPTDELNSPLSPRQLQALSLCAAYPDASSVDLAAKMNVANSTVRNLLSSAYLKLGVRTRAAAIAKASQLGFLSVEADFTLPTV